MSTMTIAFTRSAQQVASAARTRQTPLAVIGLLGVTAAWGSTFTMLHGITTRVPAADYSFLRFALATLVLAALKPAGLLAMPAAVRRRGLLLGLAFGFGNLLLTAGLAHTQASISGFITGMYVVFTPLFAAFLLRERLSRAAVLATVLATAGLAVISVTGSGSLGIGEAMTLAGAALFALQIIGLGRWSRAEYTVEMAVLQAGVTALVSLVFALPGGIALPQGSADWLALVYMAVVVGAVTMLLQTWAQTRLHPTRAAVVMTLEPVWAAAFAIGLGGEAFTLRLALGGALVLGAMFLSESRS